MNAFVERAVFPSGGVLAERYRLQSGKPFCTTEILPGFRGGIPDVFNLPSCPGGLPCACEVPSSPPAPPPNVTGTSGQVMMYDDSNGATPATLGLAPSNPSFPAICYPLSGASQTFTWIPTLGIWR